LEKKIIIVLLLLILIPFLVSADTINNYAVKNPVPVGQYATAYGLFQDTDANVHGDVLCSFYLLDENKVLMDRADDQYTDSLGYFMNKFPIGEPDFKRDSTYIFRVICGGISEDANFTIGQRESIAFYGQQEFNFFTSPENTDTVFILGIMSLILLVIVFAGYSVFKFAKGGN